MSLIRQGAGGNAPTMLHTMLQRHGSRQPRLAAGTARALPTAHCADPAERSAAVACLPSSPPSPRLAGTAESRSLKCNRAEQASAAGRLVRGRRTGVDLRGGGRVHPQEAQLALAGRVARRGGHLVLQLALRLVALPPRRNPPLLAVRRMSALTPRLLLLVSYVSLAPGSLPC